MFTIHRFINFTDSFIALFTLIKEKNMAKYIKQEMNDLNGTGKTQAYYRLKTTRNIDGKEFVKSLCQRFKGLSEGDAIRVLSDAAEHLANLLGEGYSVSIENIGTFKATLGLEKDKEMDSLDGDDPKHNARSLRLDGVNFRADKELVYLANKHCNLEREGISRLHHSPYTKEQRLQLALDFLEKHKIMRVVDYMLFTGLSRSTATNELREFGDSPSSGIDYIGRKSSKVYIKKILE